MKKSLLLFSVTIPLVLASCGGNLTPNSTNKGINPLLASEVPALLQQAKPIDKVYGQALTIKNALNDRVSLQSLSTKQASSTLVYDLYDQPFYQMNLLAENDLTDFWDALKASVENGQHVKITLTGASDIRNLTALDTGDQFAAKLNALQAQLGQNFKLYSPRGSVIYARQGNQFYDLNGIKVSDEQIQEDRAVYSGLVEQISQDSAFLNATRELWKSMQSSQTGGLSASGLDPANFKKDQGNLNISAFTKAAQKTGVIQAQDAADYIGCQGFLCNVVMRAKIRQIGVPKDSYLENPSLHPSWFSIKDGDFNNQQNPFTDSYLLSNLITTTSKDKWALRSANPFNSPVFNYALTGCAATAYMRLLTVNERVDPDLNTLLRKATVIDGKGYTTAQWLSRPVKADNVGGDFYEPYLTQRMGGGEFMGGTLITPNGFNAGANLANSELGISNVYKVIGTGFFKVTGNSALGNVLGVSASLSNDFNHLTWVTNATVRQTIGEQSRPVVYLYSIGGTNGYSGHYTIAHAYRTWDNWAYSDVYVYNDGTEKILGGPSGWINITNRWDTYGGAYGLVKE